MAKMAKDERLSVRAHVMVPHEGETAFSTVAFGWQEASAKANELRAWCAEEFGHGCRVEIVPDKPNENRSAFNRP